MKFVLGDCKQGKTKTVATYFGRLNKIWEDLETYVIIPRCKCGGCKCGLSAQFEKLHEEDRLHKFLIGLDGAYSVVRSNIFAQDPLSSLNRVYQQITEEERLCDGESSSMKEDCDNIMTFKVQTNAKGKSKYGDNSDKFCTHCNREGHDESTCFQIHGLPKWWGDRPHGGCGPSRGGGAASRGGRVGRGFSNVPVRANKTTSSISATQQSGNLPSNPKAAGLAGLRDEDGDWSG